MTSFDFLPIHIFFPPKSRQKSASNILAQPHQVRQYSLGRSKENQLSHTRRIRKKKATLFACKRHATVYSYDMCSFPHPSPLHQHPPLTTPRYRKCPSHIMQTALRLRYTTHTMPQVHARPQLPFLVPAKLITHLHRRSACIKKVHLS